MPAAGCGEAEFAADGSLLMRMGDRVVRVREPFACGHQEPIFVANEDTAVHLAPGGRWLVLYESRWDGDGDCWQRFATHQIDSAVTVGVFDWSGRRSLAPDWAFTPDGTVAACKRALYEGLELLRLPSVPAPPDPSGCAAPRG